MPDLILVLASDGFKLFDRNFFDFDLKGRFEYEGVSEINKSSSVQKRS